MSIRHVRNPQVQESLQDSVCIRSVRMTIAHQFCVLILRLFNYDCIGS